MIDIIEILNHEIRMLMGLTITSLIYSIFLFYENKSLKKLIKG